MYKIILAALLLEGSVIFGANEPSYYNELFRAEAQLINGEINKSKESLLALVPIYRNVKKEFNKEYALKAAELLVVKFSENDAAKEILEGIFSDEEAFVDSSLYLRASELYLAMGEIDNADRLRKKGAEQREAAWGGSLEMPEEEIDYAALGLPDPRQGL